MPAASCAARRSSPAMCANITRWPRCSTALNAPRAALVVMDRGIATEDRVQWLRENEYRYLVVSRERTRHFDAEGGTAHRDRVESRPCICTRCCPMMARRCACTASPRSAPPRSAPSSSASPNASRTGSPSSLKDSPNLAPRNDSTRSGNASVGSRRKAAASPQHYDIELDTDESGERATAVRFTRRALPGSMMTHPGVYCLPQQSNRMGRSHPVAHLLHPHRPRGGVSLAEIRTRSTPDLSPHKPIRADGHLFITVIAYQLVQVIRTRLRQGGENASWTTLRRIVEGQQRITATFQRADGATLHVRKATRAEPPQQAIYDALGIGPAPGGIRKTVV